MDGPLDFMASPVTVTFYLLKEGTAGGRYHSALLIPRIYGGYDDQLP
jgi:hypothetical protein